jgi:hypothetical protein
MNTTEFPTQLPTDSACGRIAVTNPFDGVEVGAVFGMPPQGAQAILRVARDGAHSPVVTDLESPELSRAYTCSVIREVLGQVGGVGRK